MRVQLLKLMGTPITCTQLGKALGEGPQKVYYHVKKLHVAGLVDKGKEQSVRGIMEGFYQAKASSYWLSPRLIGKIGGLSKAQDQLSLAHIQSLAEQLHIDVGILSQNVDEDVPSIGLSASIELKDQIQRAAFAQDVQTMFKNLAAKYGNTGSTESQGMQSKTFNIMLACYPHPESDKQPKGEYDG